MTVKDNGIGIREHIVSQIFNDNHKFKDDQNKKRIGLGLVMSKMIVKQFQGDIDLISEFGKGSTFFFSFEILELAAENAATNVN